MLLPLGGKIEGEEIVGHRKVYGQGPSLCDGPSAKPKFTAWSFILCPHYFLILSLLHKCTDMCVIPISQNMEG